MAFVRATLLAVLAMAPVGAFVPSTFGGVHSTARVHSTRVTPVMGGKENALWVDNPQYRLAIGDAQMKVTQTLTLTLTASRSATRNEGAH